MPGIHIVEGKKKGTFNVYIVEIIFYSLFCPQFLVLNKLDSPISVTTHLFILSFERYQ